MKVLKKTSKLEPIIVSKKQLLTNNVITKLHIWSTSVSKMPVAPFTNMV